MSTVGKSKTALQMTAITMMLWQQPLWGMPVYEAGVVLFYVAAALTLWSMVLYLQAAWPSLRKT